MHATYMICPNIKVVGCRGGRELRAQVDCGLEAMKEEWESVRWSMHNYNKALIVDPTRPWGKGEINYNNSTRAWVSKFDNQHRAIPR